MTNTAPLNVSPVDAYGNKGLFDAPLNSNKVTEALGYAPLAAAPVLVALGILANAPGVLTNNGIGGLSWGAGGGGGGGSNLDGGTPSSTYGGTTPIDGGTP